MAHILVADYDRATRSMLSQALPDFDETHDHWVTCVDNPWALLSAMRSTLHPMVVLFYNLMLFDRRGGGDEFPFDILLRDEADLRRHRLIEMHADTGERPPEVRAFYDRLGVQQISMPFMLETLVDLVNQRADELEGAG